jgi:arginase family enzyme
MVPIVVSFDTGVLSGALTPLSNSSQSPLGLHLEEATEIVRICGAHHNVSSVDIYV